MRFKISKLHTVLSIILIFLTAGCASHRPKTDPFLDKKAFALGAAAILYNQTISSSRGSGWAILETPDKTDKFRVAWAAVYPDKIRMTFLVSGVPVETILMSKGEVTFLSHTGQHARYSYLSEDPDMEKFIQVPVKMSEIIMIFLGRYPIKTFDDAYFTPTGSIASDIALKNIDTHQTQYLKFNPQGFLDSLTTTDFLDDELYTLKVKGYKNFDTRQIPAQIIITDTYRRKLTLKITDFKANPVLKDSVFQLTGP